MTLNAYQMARGMGALDDIYAQPGVFGSNGGGGNWYQDWGGGLINQAGQIITSIWGNRSQPNTSLLQQQIAAQQAALEAQRRAAAAGDSVADDSDTGIGIKFTDKGLKLGEKTTITYSTMLIGGVILFLVQSPGFQRKGR